VIIFSGDIVKGYARGDEWIRAKRSGDTPDRTLETIRDEESEDLEFYDRFFWALAATNRPVMFVPGNMDAPLERFRRIATDACTQYPNLHLVHDSQYQFQEVSFWGFGGEITVDEGEDFFVFISPRSVIMDSLPEPKKNRRNKTPTILITHSPPIGEVVDIENNAHKGSSVINEVIDVLEPSIAFCGHAHRGQGEEQIGSTTVINPGALKSGNYAFVHFDPATNLIKVTFGNLLQE